MGVLFDYTQAEEAEPEMGCLGRFYGGSDKQPSQSVPMQGLLRTGFS